MIAGRRGRVCLPPWVTPLCFDSSLLLPLSLSLSPLWKSRWLPLLLMDGLDGWMDGLRIDPVASLSGSDPGDVPIKLFRYFFRGRFGGTNRRWLGLVVA